MRLDRESAVCSPSVGTGATPHSPPTGHKPHSKLCLSGEHRAKRGGLPGGKEEGGMCTSPSSPVFRLKKTLYRYEEPKCRLSYQLLPGHQGKQGLCLLDHFNIRTPDSTSTKGSSSTTTIDVPRPTRTVGNINSPSIGNYHYSCQRWIPHHSRSPLRISFRCTCACDRPQLARHRLTDSWTWKSVMQTPIPRTSHSIRQMIAKGRPRSSPSPECSRRMLPSSTSFTAQGSPRLSRAS